MNPPNGPTAVANPDDRIGTYRLVRVLGAGGSGTVFLADREDRAQGQVAIKVLHETAALDATLARRFAHEGRVAASLRHPGLVPLLETGEADGRAFIVSRYMAGGSLAARLAGAGALSIADALRLLREVAAGVDALHAAGIVHRDIKPANILLERDGSAALGDFGLARRRRDSVLTRPGQVLGSMDYLAPELIQGHPATSASDVYALGCVAYAVLIGKPPFSGRSTLRTAFGHLDEVPVGPIELRPDIGPMLSASVLHALAKAPADRPRGAIAYTDALASAAAPDSSPVKP